MNKPHKHAALIKAWADNPQLEVQFRGASCQSNCWYKMSPTQPDWSHSEVRIKPKTIKYRLALVKGHEGVWVNAAMDRAEEVFISDSGHFVKWLGDWQVVEI